MTYQDSLSFGESIEVTVIRATPKWIQVIKNNWILIAVVIAIIIYLYWKSKQKPKEEIKWTI